MCVSAGSKIEVYEGAHNNLPDEDAYNTATKIHQLITSLTDEDLLIVLISGTARSASYFLALHVVCHRF